MSVDYCEHNYPVNSDCPRCKVARLTKEVAELKAALNGSRTRSNAFEEMLKDSLAERDRLQERLLELDVDAGVQVAALTDERDRLKGERDADARAFAKQIRADAEKIAQLTRERDEARADLQWARHRP